MDLEKAGRRLQTSNIIDIKDVHKGSSFNLMQWVL